MVLVRALGIELAFESGSALVDHGLELIVVDIRECEVEDIAGKRGEGREEAVEEDRVEDAWAIVSPFFSLLPSLHRLL